MTAPINANDAQVLKALDTLLQPVRHRMALGVFVKKYLPFLSLQPIPEEVVGQMLAIIESKTGAKHTRGDLHGNLLNEWMGDVGSPYVEVEVYDTEGNIVYIVPPFLNNSEELVENAASLPVMVEQASLQGRVLPEQAFNYIQQNIIPLIHKPAPSQKHIDMWNTIYRYHDLPLYKIVQKDETGKVIPDGHDKEGRLLVENIDDFDD